MSSNTNLACIATICFEWKAHILAEILTDNGIENYVTGNPALGAVMGYSVMVDANKIEQAVALLEEFDKEPGQQS